MVTTIDDILPKCLYKKNQENGKSFFMLCYDCNGYQPRAKEISCLNYTTLPKDYKLQKPKK